MAITRLFASFPLVYIMLDMSLNHLESKNCNSAASLSHRIRSMKTVAFDRQSAVYLPIGGYYNVSLVLFLLC